MKCSKELPLSECTEPRKGNDMKTVMIVDDELPSRQLLMMACDWNALGFTILCEARNGKEALELYEINRPDLVITDIQMSVMDGLELIKAIRSKKSSYSAVMKTSSRSH